MNFSLARRKLNNNSNKRRILLVDDERDINLTVKTVLEEYGFVVNFYDDPLAALEDFKAKSYDLVVLDIKMPHLNGLQLYRELKKKDKNAKICFLTAGDMYYGAYEDIFSKVDWRCFIRKPISNEDLSERINEIITIGSEVR
jgi:DNA-binding response OmpR family regulator